MKTFSQFIIEVNLLTGDKRKHTDLAKAAASRATRSYQKASEAHASAKHHAGKGDRDKAAEYRALGSRHYADYREHAAAMHGHDADAKRVGSPNPEMIKPRTKFMREPK